MPTVSVVVPAYEAATVLPRAVESVLDQTLADLELFVVDDGSTDRTGEAAADFDDPRVTHLAHERNRGASAARNTGIERATGEYVAFLDADDEWLPTKLERQVAALERSTEDWVAAYCGTTPAFDGYRSRLRERLVRRLSRRRRTEGTEGGAELVPAVLADDLHTSAGSTLLVRRSVAEAMGGFDESFDRFQDSEFLVRVLRRGRLVYVDEPLVRRTVSGDPPADVVREADEHYLRTFADAVERAEALGYDVRGAHSYLLARHYLREGRFRTGLAYLRRARRPEPRQYPGLARTLLAGMGRKLGR